LKKILIIAILFILLCLAGVIWGFTRTIPAANSVQINDLVRVASEMDCEIESVNHLTDGLEQLFYEMDEARGNRDRFVQVFLLIIGIFLIATVIFLHYYYHQKVIAPFQRLQGFAKQIAGGNLDFPLEMDRSNIFGAFTESFDLMREELQRARENEYKANQSKKELIASLSHDIKTPVASIKAITELMLVKPKDEKEQKQLETINEKAEQINALITNMFHATLEELEALPIFPEEMASTRLSEMIDVSDYNQRVTPFSIPPCLVLADPLRLQQIFDNIIHNSYKYADTAIAVSGFFQDNYLVVEIKDFGEGVSVEDTALLFQKFYRGKNASQKAGYGLGLYIANYFMTEMDGKLEIPKSNEIKDKKGDGFTIRMYLKLS